MDGSHASGVRSFQPRLGLLLIFGPTGKKSFSAYSRLAPDRIRDFASVAVSSSGCQTACGSRRTLAKVHEVTNRLSSRVKTRWLSFDCSAQPKYHSLTSLLQQLIIPT